jgi:uncharacterized protein (TIGR02117 family)
LVFFPSRGSIESKKDEKIYIYYNKVHSDIVLKVADLPDLWIEALPIPQKRKEGYIAFGWGDKDTYLNTPTWNDIKVSTSLKALFLNTSSLMHVSYHYNIEQLEDLKAITLSKVQKNQIKASIFKSFSKEKKIYHGYGRNDIFYNSPYKYNFIFTCNTWTGNILRSAKIPLSYWTPFSSNIINSLD